LKLITQLNLFESRKYTYLSIQENELFLKDFDSNQIIQEAKTIEDIKDFSKEYILCITNEEYKKLNKIKNQIPNIYSIIQYITLFCRMSKSNKIEIISNLKSYGRNTLMCGDGTNDIGALKLAKVGVTLLNIKESFVG
jgi:cation-transporting ATPase 13A1